MHNIPYPKTNFAFRTIKITNGVMWVFHGQLFLLFIFGEPRLRKCAASTRRGANSNEDYSYGRPFNTSSKMNTGFITIKMEFAEE